MLTYSCATCCSAAPPAAISCPTCGAVLNIAMSYDAALLRALRHPVAETRSLAATILVRHGRHGPMRRQLLRSTMSGRRHKQP